MDKSKLTKDNLELLIEVVENQGNWRDKDFKPVLKKLMNMRLSLLGRDKERQ